MSLHTITTISINGLQITSFEQLQITQEIDGHHTFEILISQDKLRSSGKTLFEQIKDLFGKEVRIEIKPELPGSSATLLFRGIATNIVTGKSVNGIDGFCNIKGHSPTILLDDDPSIAVFEEKSLQAIAGEILKKYPSNLLKSNNQPKHKDLLKYSVQYKENSWHYLQRLASSYGEWLFYDGSNLNFGEIKSGQVTLSHLKDLLSFDLEIGVKSSNINFHSYEYINDKPVKVDTKSQNSGTFNKLTDHVLKISDSLYSNQALYKVNQVITDQAQQELKQMAKLQRSSRIAQMVFAKGVSTSLELKIGSVAEIKEDFRSTAEHGKYFITHLVHHCDGDGNYQNFFTSIPSDTAVPSYHPEHIPHCEAQSAVVVENHDDKGLGRVKVKFHWQEKGTTPWIRIVSAAGGGDKGFYFIPEKGEEVWVDFEGGNPELPFVVGTKYNGNAKSSFGNKDNDIKAIRTRSGHTIELIDKKGEEEVHIYDAEKSNVIILSSHDKTMKIVSKGDLSLQGKNVSITAEDKLSLESKNKEVSVKSSKALSLESVSDNITLKTSKKMMYEAMELNIAAKQKIQVDGGMQATVKSMKTTVQGTTSKIEVM